LHLYFSNIEPWFVLLSAGETITVAEYIVADSTAQVVLKVEGGKLCISALDFRQGTLLTITSMAGCTGMTNAVVFQIT
jgi:hypothetical protein